MAIANKFRVFFLVLGDIVALYASLILTLVLRYGSGFYTQFRDYHFAPFTIIFAVWIVIFYIAGLYDLKHVGNKLNFFKILASSLAVNFGLAAILFYLIPAFGITPKTNLFLFLVVFAVVESFWRKSFSDSPRGEAPNKILLIEDGEASINQIISSDQNWLSGFGYKIVSREKESSVIANPEKLSSAVKNSGVNVVIIPRHLKNNPRLTKELYKLLSSGLEIRDLPNFYEMIARKVPLSELEESWFLDNLVERQKFYDPLKRAWEFLAALSLGIVLLPLEALIAIIIKFTSKGPAIYKQKRVGEGGKEFVLYKWRTMPVGSEQNGAVWSGPDDNRPTKFGKFLRYTHLDELPQLWNIIKNDLSFVGPRPERPEFVKTLKEKIPYYEIRLLVKPGVTGWAQINHPADVSHEDVVEKLQYDIYYIKNRSPILDFAIILKTIKTLFVSPK